MKDKRKPKPMPKGMRLRTRGEIKAALENPEFLYVNINAAWTTKDDAENEAMLEGGFVLDWMAKKIGFGQITFIQSGPDVKSLKVKCQSERMGREFVAKALAHLAKTIEIVE